MDNKHPSRTQFLPSSPPLDDGEALDTTQSQSQPLGDSQLETAALSSDPPLFSSDDWQCSALENYYPTTGQNSSIASLDEVADAKSRRRKRAYRGTWWGEEVTPKRPRTGWKSRGKVDSGCFMGSDDDVDDDDDDGKKDIDCDEMLVCESITPKAKHTTVFSTDSTPVRRSPMHRDRIAINPEPENIARARNQINWCLENGDDRIDLS